MRIYTNFKESMGEIKRDLAEMGIRVHPKTYQDKLVEGNPDFETMELQNYIYTVTGPKTQDLSPSQPWSDSEFFERISPCPANPGQAWILRKEVWKHFLTSEGKFAYTYQERLHYNDQINKLVKAFEYDNHSRQLFLSIWSPDDTSKLGGVSRVPCSLGYHFQYRDGVLNMTYLQRSADFATHFMNDVYLAAMFQQYMASKISKPVGMFTHWIASLHVFQKDVRDVF